MAYEYTEEEKEELLIRYGSTFEKMQDYDSKQISDILVNAFNNGLLAICGALYEEEDVNECVIAFAMANKMLRSNHITLNNSK